MADDRARALFTQAQSLKIQGEAEQAVALLEKARALAPEALGILAELGILYRDLGCDDVAIECLETYGLRKPNAPPILFVLRNLLISQGNVTRGVALLEQAINKDPQLVPGFLALSRAKGEVLTEFHITILKKSLEREDLDNGIKSSICFALGVAHDSPGSEDRAFDYWKQANAYRYAALQDKTDSNVTIMMAMRQVFSSDLLANLSPSNIDDRLPVFVVGMLRSGTSLVEQILASHSQVFGARELNILPSTIKTKISNAIGAPLMKAISQCRTSDFDEAARHYLQALKAHSPNSSRIVDKMPHNFILIGVIQLILPGATIIHLRRDPMDTCWSIFKPPLNPAILTLFA